MNLSAVFRAVFIEQLIFRVQIFADLSGVRMFFMPHSTHGLNEPRTIGDRPIDSAFLIVRLYVYSYSEFSGFKFNLSLKTNYLPLPRSI